MTVNIPKLLALDFDGVICDGLIEYFEVSWRTYCAIWSPSSLTLPDDLAAKFYRLRPVIETGWEMPVLIAALLAGFTEEQIFAEWTTIATQLLQSHNLIAADVGHKLDSLRDEWIATDLDGWLSLHRFYPGVVEKIISVTDSAVHLYIVTTKEGRFAQQLLRQAGVEIKREQIFGKEVKRPKAEILRQLIQFHAVMPVDVWFVEDRLKTLQLVQSSPDLDGVKLFLADWGYNTPIERQAGVQNPRINLLSLSQFGKDFVAWL